MGEDNFYAYVNGVLAVVYSSGWYDKATVEKTLQTLLNMGMIYSYEVTSEPRS